MYEVPNDYFKLEEAIYELTKLERKLRLFWFYPGRHLTYEEALLDFQYESKNHPKFQPKAGIHGEKNYALLFE